MNDVPQDPDPTIDAPDDAFAGDAVPVLEELSPSDE